MGIKPPQQLHDTTGDGNIHAGQYWYNRAYFLSGEGQSNLDYFKGNMD
jgi:hypothetical protein